MRYILVHGTFDTDKSDEGARWWQKGGEMRRDIEAMGADIVAFRWSGANSDSERDKAAKRLATLLKSFPDDGETAIIAHSHGGNVAWTAAAQIDETRAKKLRIVTVGTPFLIRKGDITTTSPIRRTVLAATGAAAVTIVGLFLVDRLSVEKRIPMSEFKNSMTEGAHRWRGNGDYMEILSNDAIWGYAILGVFVLTVATFLFLYFGIAGRGTRRRRALSASLPMACIHHPADEAIAVLARVHTARLRAMTSNAAASIIARGVGRPAVLLTAVAAFAIPFFSLWYSLLTVSDLWMPRIDASGPTVVGGVNLAAPAISILLFLVFTILVVIGAALLFWFISSTLEVLFAPVMASYVNGVVNGAARSAAFGLDGPYRVVGVDAVPNKASRVVPLPDPLAKRFISETSQHLADRVARLKTLVADAADLGADPLQAMHAIFEWNELIHTFYFRDPECRRLILAEASLR